MTGGCAGAEAPGDGTLGAGGAPGSLARVTFFRDWGAETLTTRRTRPLGAGGISGCSAGARGAWDGGGAEPATGRPPWRMGWSSHR